MRKIMQRDQVLHNTYISQSDRAQLRHNYFIFFFENTISVEFPAFFYSWQWPWYWVLANALLEKWRIPLLGWTCTWCTSLPKVDISELLIDTEVSLSFYSLSNSMLNNICILSVLFLAFVEVRIFRQGPNRSRRD